jgi:hypothetical protein
VSQFWAVQELVSEAVAVYGPPDHVIPLDALDSTPLGTPARAGISAASTASKDRTLIGDRNIQLNPSSSWQRAYWKTPG